MPENVTFKGPIFINAPKHLKEAANTALMEVAQTTSRLVKAQLYPNHGRVTGRLRSSVMGELVKDFTAVVTPSSTAAGNPIRYANWVEGISSRNKRTKFKGYGMFKKVHQHLNSRPAWLEKIFGDELMRAFGP